MNIKPLKAPVVTCYVKLKQEKVKKKGVSTENGDTEW